ILIGASGAPGDADKIELEINRLAEEGIKVVTPAGKGKRPGSPGTAANAFAIGNVDYYGRKHPESPAMDWMSKKPDCGVVGVKVPVADVNQDYSIARELYRLAHGQSGSAAIFATASLVMDLVAKKAGGASGDANSIQAAKLAFRLASRSFGYSDP